MAISSSCGALDNIAVDTIDTAQKCVTFLKEQNIGVATFIGLDKVKRIRVYIGHILNQVATKASFCKFFFIHNPHLICSDESVGEEHGSDSHSRRKPSSL